ncbi:XRE family transcriptional regulator [Streptomyces sp. NPDC002221]|uniref:XRE family transcriptional regulator n=1 Tax=Streptomyces sp. NPDC002221 TaxID=3364639 RepID=UPI0036B39248
MKRARNKALAAWMDAHDISPDALADQVNKAVGEITGKTGETSERNVFRWLSGETRWPQLRQRLALEAVSGRPVRSLGSVPRGEPIPPVHPEDDPVLRRAFMTAATGTALALTPSTTVAAGRLGRGDVERLNARFADLVVRDHRRGGQLLVERRAIELSEEALRLQQDHSASQRVRSSLYACAAAFMSSAMWAAIDGKRFGAAQNHLNRASGLAAMSGEQGIQFRIWSHAGSLYRHMGRPADAPAANDVARNLAITRRDPMFASLGHARHAAILGLAGSASMTDRCIGYASEALDRADAYTPRPVWITAFFGPSEIDSLSSVAHLALGQYERAEAEGHRSLAYLQPHMERSRAIMTVRVARAQLGQGDLDHAVSTAMSVPSNNGHHPRVIAMLDTFTTKLNSTAPDSNAARTWASYLHDYRKALPT